MWTPEEDAILHAVYADDAIEYTLATAMERLPGRTISATSMRACTLGLPEERRRRREAAGLPVRPSGTRKVKPSKYASLPIAPLPAPEVADPPPPVIAAAPPSVPEQAKPAPAPPAPKPRAGPSTSSVPGACDPGDREHIRRRIVMATIPTLARELQRSPDAIAATLRELAADGFRAPKSIGLTPEEIAGSVLGQDRGRPDVRARRGSIA